MASLKIPGSVLEVIAKKVALRTAEIKNRKLCVSDYDTDRAAQVLVQNFNRRMGI